MPFWPHGAGWRGAQGLNSCWGDSWRRFRPCCTRHTAVMKGICPWGKKEGERGICLFFLIFSQKTREEEGKAKTAGKHTGSLTGRWTWIFPRIRLWQLSTFRERSSSTESLWSTTTPNWRPYCLAGSWGWTQGQFSPYLPTQWSRSFIFRPSSVGP